MLVQRWLWSVVLIGSVLAFLVGCQPGASPQAPAPAAPTTPPATPTLLAVTPTLATTEEVAADDCASFVYTPMPTGFDYPADKASLQAQVDAGDIQAMRQHGWNIWAAMTQPSGQCYNQQALPVWETWFSGTDVYVNGPLDVSAPRGIARHFEEPRQLDDLGVQLTGDESLEAEGQDNPEEITSFNKFSAESAQFIWDNGYYLAETLDQLNASWPPDTPIEARTLTLPDRAIALKPVFELVKQGQLNAIPYWAGISDATTTNPATPSPDTWKQCVALDLTGAHSPGETVSVTCNGATVEATVVALEDFYHFPLTAAEIEALSPDAESEFTGAAPGDYALFVAMHVTTREIDNWTWQTFWWSPQADDSTSQPFPPTSPQTTPPTYSNYPGSGADRPPTVVAPWDNYVMCTAYSMVVPPQPRVGGSEANTLPEICFNPYLETSFAPTGAGALQGDFSSGGINSNCMTCHGRATWPPQDANYWANGYFPRDSQVFSGTTQLDFSWNITRARTPTPTP